MIAGIVQARMNSTRLPGKVMADIIGAPMIARIVERVRKAPCVDQVAIATTTEPSDDVLAEFANAHGIGCYRGSVDDIVDRLCGAVNRFNVDVLVRIWGDCPFADAEVINEAVEKLMADDLDHVCNFIHRTFPFGLELEVYRRETLDFIRTNTGDHFYREFPFEYLMKNSAKFRLGTIQCDEDLSGIHLTVDYPEDLALARAVYASLYRPGASFGFRDIVTFINNHPELVNDGAQLVRNADYLQKKSEHQ